MMLSREGCTRRCSLTITVQPIQPVGHLPLVLGVLRCLEVATVIDHLIPPHSAPGLSCGRGVEALVLARLDGDHALYQVGRRLEERGMVALLQPGLPRASLHDYRRGHILDALFAANLNRSKRVQARWGACRPDAEAALAEDEGQRPGRHGRRPRPWR
jgi:hypothetical protein